MMSDGIARQMNRSNRPEVFCKKGILRNSAKFTGKHQCQSLFFRPATLLKRRDCGTGEHLRTSFLTEHLWWLLLDELTKKFYKQAALDNSPSFTNCVYSDNDAAECDDKLPLTSFRFLLENLKTTLTIGSRLF